MFVHLLAVTISSVLCTLVTPEQKIAFLERELSIVTKQLWRAEQLRAVLDRGIVIEKEAAALARKAHQLELMLAKQELAAAQAKIKNLEAEIKKRDAEKPKTSPASSGSSKPEPTKPVDKK